MKQVQLKHEGQDSLGVRVFDSHPEFFLGFKPQILPVDSLEQDFVPILNNWIKASDK